MLRDFEKLEAELKRDGALLLGGGKVFAEAKCRRGRVLCARAG
jgi:hypothetical protein